MKARLRISLGILVLVLLALGVLLPDDTKESREQTFSTYGKAPDGYGAVFDLLRELDFPVGRSLAAPTRLASAQTLWWLAPKSLCKRIESTQNGVGGGAQSETPEEPDSDAKPAPKVPGDKPAAPTPDEPGLGELAWLRSTQKSDEPSTDSAAPNAETDESVPDADDASDGEDVSQEWPGLAWVEQGGTALVFLASANSCECGRGWIYECGQIGGVALPSRHAPDPLRREAHAPQSDRHETLLDGEAVWAPVFAAALASVGRQPVLQVENPSRVAADERKREPKKRDDPDEEEAPSSMLDTVVQHFESDFSPAPRVLETQGLLAFDETLDWQVRGTLDRQPFVLERAFGAGRIVVIADVAFLRNAWLDAADAAPLAVDLARAYGPPLFDEYEHGFRVEHNALHYLLRSRALPLFVGLALLGALYAWRGGAYPRRSVREIDVGVPTLETFVDSVATLYSRTRDFERVFECYRELTLDRIRRHCGLAPSASLREVKERLERDARISRKMVGWLVDPPAVRSAGELRAAVQMLDLLFDEVRR